ncbi:MAG: hypothetical protein IKE53_07300 [Clostridiales bacterium]|nr:hypothetical protein [Clostridiales bacterium]
MITEEQFLHDFKDLLETDESINMEMDLLDIDAWNSFSAMAFLAMIDEKYGIKTEPFSVAEAVLVEDLYHLVNVS